MYKIFISAIFVFFLSPMLKAQIVLEPYIGLGLGSFTSASNELNQDGNTTMYTLGGRGGFSFSVFDFGVDYSLNSGSFDGKSVNLDYKATTLSLYCRYNLPTAFSFWLAYSLSHDADLDGTGVDISLEGRDIYGAVSFSGFFPFVILNFEYHVQTYSDAKSSGTPVSLSSTDGNIMMVTASFKLDL